MNGEFLGALEQIASEKGIDKEILVNAIEAALLSAYKKNYWYQSKCKSKY